MERNPSEDEKQKELEVKMMQERVLRVLLTPESRQRLNNIRMVKPDLARGVEEYLISMGSQGRLNKEVTDEELKQILVTLQGQQKRDFKINYK